MNRLLRLVLPAALAFVLIQPVAFLTPAAFASASPPSTTKVKKRKKHKKKDKEVVLKGHRGKHAHKPA